MAAGNSSRSIRDRGEQALARRAARQDGVLARGAQRGAWERVHAGVYRFTAAQRTWRGEVFAAVAAWGEGAVASHRCAALWSMTGFRPGCIELIVPRNRVRVLDHLVHRPTSFEPAEGTTVEAIPVTAPARTLLDLAATCAGETVEEALDDALRRRLVTLPALQWRLEQTAIRGKPGIATLRALVRARDAGVPESRFERRLLRALRQGGLPEPILQHEVRAGRILIACIDFAYPAQRVAIEADGFRWHSMRSDFERDARRQSALASLGWRVIRVTWSQLHNHPDEVVASIRDALR